MTFTQAGDYTLTVWEEQGSADHVTYDGTRYTVIIHVVDYSGVLSATVECILTAMWSSIIPTRERIQTRIPTSPQKPGTLQYTHHAKQFFPASGGTAGPQTGDQMPVISIVVIALVAACVALLLVLGKQRKNRK